MTISGLKEAIRIRCLHASLKPVSRKAIEMRIARLDPRLVKRGRHGPKAAHEAFGPVGGSYEINEPLAVMQIDHTPVDAIVVDSLTRKPIARPWTLTDTDICTVCGLCLDEDLCHGRVPYLRAEWRQSWRIFCSVHEVRLLPCPMTVFTSNASEASMVETIADLYAHCDLVQDNINRAFLHLTVAIDEMELVIRRAIAGEGPDAVTWGPLRANEFLQIVHDVTSWALTNFEAFKARPAAEELPHGISGTGSPYFRKAPRLQPPYDSDAIVRTLSSVNDPALRCAALWWAHVLLAESHPCRNPTRLGPPSRQWNLLQSRCPVGLHWLNGRMKHWPREYVRRQWSPLESLLLPGE